MAAKTAARLWLAAAPLAYMLAMRLLACAVAQACVVPRHEKAIVKATGAAGGAAAMAAQVFG